MEYFARDSRMASAVAREARERDDESETRRAIDGAAEPARPMLRPRAIPGLQPSGKRKI